MEDIHAEDIMIPLDAYPHVPHWFSIRQAIIEMEKAQFERDGRKSLPHYVLIFDDEYRLMGLAKRRDMLRGLGPNALQDKKEKRGEKDPGIRRDRQPGDDASHASVKDLSKRAEMPVSEIMTPVRATLEHDVPLLEVADFMVVNDVSIVPVLKDGAVIGVVRSTEVLHRIAKKIISPSELRA
jgi:CBS-domain-containing membrane protein